MGSIEPGVPYQEYGLRFELVLDEPVHEAAARKLTEQILRQSAGQGPRLFPSSFIAYTDGSRRATATFAERLDTEELTWALRTMCMRLVNKGYLDVVPTFPSPLYIVR